jgi:hypothetical protein
MAATMKKRDEQNWRSKIVQQLQARNKSQCQSYQDLISFRKYYKNYNNNKYYKL